jgi:hypothetical protein
MAISDHSNAATRRPRRSGALTLPLIGMLTLAVLAAGFIGYVLWPRWPGPPVPPDAPALPITVAGTPFNVPPAAMRIPLQRRAGAHERVDLAFLWPSLAPPDSGASGTRAPGAPPQQTVDRLFVTISAAGDSLAPAERIKTIYPRYAAADAAIEPNGLAIKAFRIGTPYQGEDLIYDSIRDLRHTRGLRRALQPQRRRPHARHVSLQPAYRPCRHCGAFSARLAFGLASDRHWHRAPD